MLTHQFISELIAATRTDTGHTVRCRLDQATYPKGIIVTDDQLADVNITRGAFHGEWNYTIAPRTTELVEPSPEPIAVIIAVRPLSFATSDGSVALQRRASGAPRPGSRCNHYVKNVCHAPASASSFGRRIKL